MANQRLHQFQLGHHIAFGSAHMIAIKHQLYVRRAHSRDDVCGLLLRVQEIARRVKRVQGLDQDGLAMLGGFFTGKLQVRNETGTRIRPARKSGHDVGIGRCLESEGAESQTGGKGYWLCWQSACRIAVWAAFRSDRSCGAKLGQYCLC